MRVLMNGLSATNLSGRNVLLGHLSRLAAWTVGEHEYVVLHHKSNRDLCRDLGPNVEWLECPARTAHWWARSLWERGALKRLLSERKIDVLFTPSGTVIPGCRVPQVSMALNPWRLVRRTQRSVSDRLKARLQRRAYRQAVRKAAMMAYASAYMRDAYRANAGRRERAYEIVYPGLNDDVLEAVEDAAGGQARRRDRIVCVSLMAPHKGVETVVEALAYLHRDYKAPAELVLVGGWPDKGYEAQIRRLVERRQLERHVTFEGHVPRQRLFEHYARARVFCLMSWCESFGIPSVEAQSFGTPVVSSNCCAIPEVCGAGGLYPEPGDPGGTAEALAGLLTDEAAWKETSEAAVRNAAKYRYDTCTLPLMKMFDVAAQG